VRLPVGLNRADSHSRELHQVGLSFGGIASDGSLDNLVEAGKAHRVAHRNPPPINRSMSLISKRRVAMASAGEAVIQSILGLLINRKSLNYI
jgi:hypothetical protein